MEKCISKLGCELCTCVFEDDTPEKKVDAEKYVKHLDLQKTLYWVFNYTTLEAEPKRHLCRIGTCKKCGKFYCESIAIPDELSGDDVLACVYRLFYQQACIFKYGIVNRFNGEFLKLFDDKDKFYVAKWLRNPGNQNNLQMYRNQEV